MCHCHNQCTYQYFPQKEDGGVTRGIRQKKDSDPEELDRVPRHRGGKIRLFIWKFSFDYIINFIARPCYFLDTTYLPLGGE